MLGSINETNQRALNNPSALAASQNPKPTPTPCDSGAPIHAVERNVPSYHFALAPFADAPRRIVFACPVSSPWEMLGNYRVDWRQMAGLAHLITGPRSFAGFSHSSRQLASFRTAAPARNPSPAPRHHDCAHCSDEVKSLMPIALEVARQASRDTQKHDWVSRHPAQTLSLGTKFMSGQWAPRSEPRRDLLF